jgi:uncharacterized membrane protein YccF (DUF307 family)
MCDSEDSHGFTGSSIRSAHFTASLVALLVAVALPWSPRRCFTMYASMGLTPFGDTVTSSSSSLLAVGRFVALVGAVHAVRPGDIADGLEQAHRTGR